MFRYSMLTLVVALASSDSGGSHGKDAATDDARLHGTWEIVSLESSGEVGMEGIGVRLTFASGKIRITKTPRDVYCQITYRVNPAKRPRQIDLAVKEGSDEVEIAGIYRLDGDRLTLCLASPTEPDVIYEDPFGFMYLRPKKFSSRVHALLVLQRVKTPPTPKTNPDQPSIQELFKGLPDERTLRANEKPQPRDEIAVFRHHPALPKDDDGAAHDAQLVYAKAREHRLNGVIDGGLGRGYDFWIARENLPIWEAVVDELKDEGSLTYYVPGEVDDSGCGFLPIPPKTQDQP